ncbi:MAG: gliding motility-associated ABC transporter substrate-binding protein GldG [Bacteroidetes bacterium]|nr:gliding motility-associated ABC transporter substrate-binding protein GldG [Bacteroidota bacterium]
MKKNRLAKYWWIGALAALVLVNILASFIHMRADLTAEKRYTLSSSTRRMLGGLKDRVDIKIFLEGSNMPAAFKKLRNSTIELLEGFKETGRGNLHFSFEKPGEGLTDSVRTAFLDSLARLGIKPYTIQAQVKEGEGSEERQVVPGALITYKGRVLAVDMLAGQNSGLDEGSINRVEATLEYKFASAIRRISQDTVPLVGYLTGNGEPLSYSVYDLIGNNLKRNYAFNIFNIDSFPTIPSVFSAMLIVKPTQKFTDAQKLKLDQYVMHGGKLFWMVDRLYAEMDSLQRSQNDFIAFDRGLELDDILFRYGVRINPDIVQDLNCDGYPAVIGNQGGKPQVQILPFNYFPLLSNYNGHAIAKNLDYVVSQFPQSMDTVGGAGIRKTVLLATSEASRLLSTPAKVSFGELATAANKNRYNMANVPIAVLLEGSFSSLYTNRLGIAMRDSLNAINSPFVAQSPDSKMIVVSDGDIALNAVTQNEGPLAMGTNPFTKYKYANSEFVMNAVEYLTDNSGILETRAKDLTLRLLDKKKLEEERGKWQLINIGGPLAAVILFGLIFQFIRKRKYSSK